MKIMVVRDVFWESGEYHELLEKFGLTTGNIVTSGREIVRRKK
jgi:transketolase C-terminal domain/subunit